MVKLERDGEGEEDGKEVMRLSASD